MLFKSLLSFLFLFPSLVAFPFHSNNFDFNTHIATAASAANNNSAVHNQHNYAFSSLAIFLPAQLSLNHYPVSLRFEPFFKSYYSNSIDAPAKASFSNAFLLFSYHDLSLKLGRQYFSNPDTIPFIYFGPNDNFDVSFPSYLDGISLNISNDILNSSLLLAYADSTVAGFNVNILPYAFASLSFFAYLKDLPDNTLYLFGASSKLNITQSFFLSAAFALNSGKQKYSLFQHKFKKKYDGYFFSINSLLNLSSDFADSTLSLSWILPSPSDNTSFPFTPISDYNIYGSIAGAQQLFNNSFQAFNFNINLSPNNIPNLNLNLDAFYYSSSLRESFNRYIGTEFNISASYAFDHFNLKLAYAYMSLDKGFLESQNFANPDINKYIHKCALYLNYKMF